MSDYAGCKAVLDTSAGSMTLEFIDDSHIVQHWNALKAGEFDQVMSVEMTRVE